MKSGSVCVVIRHMDSLTFTPEDEAALRETLKRCSPETIEKAVELRKTGNAELAGPVVIGIIARFLEPEKRDLLKDPKDSLRMVDDLGLDSLTMVEIVLAVEDAVGTSIDNEDVQKIHTLGDIKAFISSKMSK